jgi:hypothetical protein
MYGVVDAFELKIGGYLIQPFDNTSGYDRNQPSTTSRRRL